MRTIRGISNRTVSALPCSNWMVVDPDKIVPPQRPPTALKRRLGAKIADQWKRLEKSRVVQQTEHRRDGHELERRADDGHRIAQLRRKS